MEFALERTPQFIVGSATLVGLGLGIACTYPEERVWNGVDVVDWFVWSVFVFGLPMMYEVGGRSFYKDAGWNFFQPGVGGRRFVVMQATAWIVYALTALLLTLGSHSGDDAIKHNLLILGAGSGILSYLLVITSLLTYKSPMVEGKEGKVDGKGVGFGSRMRRRNVSEFNEEIQNSQVMFVEKKGYLSPSETFDGFVYLLVALTGATVLLWMVLEKREEFMGGFSWWYGQFLIIGLFSSITSITHTVVGKWRNIEQDYRNFQPFMGGTRYVLQQIAGWTSLGIGISVSLVPMICRFGTLTHAQFLHPSTCEAQQDVPAHILVILGLAAETFILSSLFSFHGRAKSSDKVSLAKTIKPEQRERREKVE